MYSFAYACGACIKRGYLVRYRIVKSCARCSMVSIISPPF
nr:MAG TPA: hypothetical protein [Caudoviricetes sp.]